MYSLIVPHAFASITLASALLGVGSSTIAPATTTVSAVEKAAITECATPECVKQLIEFYAKAHDVEASLALGVARCESEFKTTAVGDSGLAYGVYQFHQPTFKEFAKAYGDPSLEYKNTEDQIELAMWAISNGKGNHWTCYRKIQRQAAKAEIAKIAEVK